MATGNQPMAFGALLRQFRLERGLSAEALAKQALGYGQGSHVAVSRLERGILGKVRTDQVRSLAEFFGQSPDEWLRLSEEAAAVARQAGQKAGAAAKKTGSGSSRRARGRAVAGGSRSEGMTRNIPVTVNPAARVRAAREKLGLDEVGFAKVLSNFGALITSRDVSLRECGDREPNPTQLRALSRASGQPESWFAVVASSQIGWSARPVAVASGWPGV